MKILFISHNNNEKSGANKSLLSILNNFKNNYEIVVLVNKTKGNLPSVIESMNIEVVESNYYWNCAQKRTGFIRQIAVITRQYFRHLMELISLNNTIKKLKKYKFDYVYTNTSVINIGDQISKKLNTKHIWHFREFRKLDFGFIDLLPKRKQSKIFNRAFKKIFISNTLSNYYKTNYNIDSSEVVYNGFEIDQYLCKSNTNNNNNNMINILISGQVSKNKGQEQAIIAVNKLSKKYAIKLYIAGTGSQEYINYLKTIDKNSCSIFLGQVSNLFEIRKKMNIELVCSTCEAFGRVTIEAMLHSLPVIASNTGANVEIINDGQTGLLYKLNDINDLCNKIELLIKNTNIRKTIIKQSLEFSKKLTIENTVGKIKNILEGE